MADIQYYFVSLQAEIYSKMQLLRNRTMLMLTAVVLFVACGYSRQGDVVAQTVPPAGYELPSYSDSEDIVRHVGYTASYNHTTLCPNWVAWILTREEEAGQLNGQYSFSRDPDVQFPKASREDYSNSGWDKGHMAPRADMKWSRKALEESYYFTNICPQDHEMNSQAWRKIEELTRRASRRYGAVMVVCGPIFDTKEPRHIGPACVHVPDRFFKALAINTSDGWQTVGFLVDNNRQGGSPRSYAVTVDSVETVVGRNLFPTLPEEAESTYNWNIWNR